MEPERKVGGVNKLDLGGGGFGRDVEEGHLAAVVDDEALRKLEEGNNVTHAGACENNDVGFHGDGFSLGLGSDHHWLLSISE